MPDNNYVDFLLGLSDIRANREVELPEFAFTEMYPKFAVGKNEFATDYKCEFLDNPKITPKVSIVLVLVYANHNGEVYGYQEWITKKEYVEILEIYDTFPHSLKEHLKLKVLDRKCL